MIGAMSPAAPEPAGPGTPPVPHGSADDPGHADSVRAALAGCSAGTEQYLRLAARLDRVSAVQPGRAAVAWQSLHAMWNRPWIIAMGDESAEVARCVVDLIARVGRPEGLTVARPAFPHLPEGLRPVEHWEWDWWYATDAPPRRAGEAHVIALDLDDPRIAALRAVASPDAMVRPGDRRIQAWNGIEASAAPTDGQRARTAVELVAVAAVTQLRPGIPHLGSVATRTQWRGQGLARDLCARMTRDLLAAGAPAVTLGMHAGNRSARQVYASLGYHVGYRWASGRVNHAPVPPDHGA
jgi:ribosomal protein S18 acetylase RimI-like enzyme